MAARSSFNPDHALAILLQAGFNEEIKKKKQNDKENDPFSVKKPPPSSLADPEWEVTDPCPDIHALFIAFNDRFFWGKLGAVEVKWSHQMTTCAGVCVYKGRHDVCSVRLSAPLLKLRPRSDLVETLLHEMIHAYLFVTENNKDRDGHGPEFHKHMYRINAEAGVNISVYHSFHAEVKLYKQHWWRCNGECQRRPPFYGMVKRACNRAPCPNDLWWNQHRAQCSGQFVKVREPEGYGKKKNKNPANKKPREGKNNRSFYNTNNRSATVTTNECKVGSNIVSLNNINNSNGFVKPFTCGGKETNPVVGFVNLSSPKSGSNGKPTPTFGREGRYVLGGGTTFRQSKSGPVQGGMMANHGEGTLLVSPKVSSSNTNLRIDSFKVFTGSGNVVGSSIGSKDKSKSRLLINSLEPVEKKPKKYDEGEWEDFGDLLREPKKTENLVNCGFCNKSMTRNEMDSHLEICLSSLNIFDEKNDNTDCPSDDYYDEKWKWNIKSCPVCGLNVEGDLEGHVNECLDSSGILNLLDDTESSIKIREDILKPMTAAGNDDFPIIEPKARVPCPICRLRFGESKINVHVNQCLDDKISSDFS